MPIEVEQKYRVTNRDTLLAKITALGATAAEPVTQVDTYYAHPVRDFATTDEALRIRRVGDVNYITYKGPKLDAATKTRREIELPIATGPLSATQCDELLQALSFRPVAEVAKTRQTFHLQRDDQTLELALDDVHQVGHYAELEIVVHTEPEIPTAQAAIATLATELQLTNPERHSYLELLLES